MTENPENEQKFPKLGVLTSVDSQAGKDIKSVGFKQVLHTNQNKSNLGVKLQLESQESQKRNSRACNSKVNYFRDRSAFKLILITEKEDFKIKLLEKAARNVGFMVIICTTKKEIHHTLKQKPIDLVIIDIRYKNFAEYEDLCQLTKTTIFVQYVNDIMQLKQNYVHCTMEEHTSCNALYTALDSSRDIIIITDSTYLCQYVNKSLQVYLNIRPEKAIGRQIHDFFPIEPHYLKAMNDCLLTDTTWAASVKLTTGAGTVEAYCSATPIPCIGKIFTHYVLVFNLQNQMANTTTESILDEVFDIQRPGSQIFKFLKRERINTTNPELIRLLNKIEDYVRSAEVYSPGMRSDFQTLSANVSENSSLLSKWETVELNIPMINRLLKTCLTWEFNIFKMEKLTNRNPLLYVGMFLFQQFNIGNTLKCEAQTFQYWLTIIEANYHRENCYHNSTHAADVMQATSGFFQQEKLRNILNPMCIATGLIAAAAHDVGHPGRSSTFLSNCSNRLAILYNDFTVLESHHSALMFKLTLGDDKVNIFKNLDNETYKYARAKVIDMILATEMTKHFEHLAKFISVFCLKKRFKLEQETIEAMVKRNLSIPENITLVERMVIKCADVSNPVRPLKLCIEWGQRIAAEYFQQTDDEKARGLPILMPMFDRNTCSIPKSQISFIDYIVNDLFEAWNAFINMPKLIIYLQNNYKKWQEYHELQLYTLTDMHNLLNPNRRKTVDD